MTYVRGFTNIDDAKAFRQDKGEGEICYADDGTGKSKNKYDYEMVVRYGWIDPVEYPICVIINNV